ncbi:MAG: metallophosphoesterase, partial [Acidobacteriota bacterium]
MIRTLAFGLVFGLALGLALAEPPDPPGGEQPPDRATGEPAVVDLCVDVFDPEGDPVDVSFFGRRRYGEPFTVIALPDTQYYSRDDPHLFDAQTEWIVEEKDARNIVFVTHLGDIVNTGSNVTQWDHAENSMSRLEDPQTTNLVDGIPYGLAVGNHDQAPLGSPRSGGDEGATTVQFNERFGKHRFADRAYYGGAYDFGDPARYPDNNDNNFEFFSAGGMDFLYIHLEYDMIASAARTAVLNWLDNMVLAHPDKRVLITTHALISNFGVFTDQGQAVYDQLKDNPNVFMMYGGHFTGARRRADLHQGHVIFSILADYQGWDLGGGAYLRIMTFVPEADEIRFETYSPWYDSYDTTDANQFVLSYPMVDPLPFRQVG